MKALIVITILLAATSIFANCENAIQSAVEDVSRLNKVLGSHDVAEDLAEALRSESALHRQVILGCESEVREVRYDYCSVVPRLLIQRNKLIKTNPNLTRAQKGDLSFINGHNQELARIVCP